MHLIELTAENFKRLSAVRIKPGSGVTAITGKNGAGKTSVLDAVACALGGGGLSPELPIKAGHTRAEVVLDLGEILVRRKWTAKGSTLEVLAKDGAVFKSPQAVLDKLVGQLSFDPLAFGRMKPSEQAATLAQLAGVSLDDHKVGQQALRDKRAAANRQAKELRGALALMAPAPAGTPDEEVSLARILDELKAAEQTEKAFEQAQREYTAAQFRANASSARIKELRQELARLEEAHGSLERDARDCAAVVNTFVVIDPEPIRQRGREAEGVNKAVRAKQLRANREREAAAKESDADQITESINDADRRFQERIGAANLQVPGLGITTDGGVFFNGIPFAQCSGAERLRVSVAIGLALNPQLKLMLIRDGSLLDDDGMKLLAEMAEAAKAQVLIERVGDSSAIGVLIVDGEVADALPEAA